MLTPFERRKYHRREPPVMMKMEYTLRLLESEILEGFVSNISSIGLCLLTSNAPNIGQELTLKNNACVHFQTARVQWVKEVNRRQYRVGIICKS
jgi:hypothetical protein